MDASGEHEVLLIVRGEFKPTKDEPLGGWWAKFRLHPQEDIHDVLDARPGSRWALRYLGDE